MTAKPLPPRVQPTSLHYKSATGDVGWFAYATNHSLEEVLAPGYFDGDPRLRRLDQIDLVAGSETDVPTLARLMVVRREDSSILVALVGEPQTVVAPFSDENAVAELMRDPRYWRHHDPELVRQVRENLDRIERAAVAASERQPAPAA